MPEGYKTGSHSAHTLFSDSTPAVPGQPSMVRRTAPRPRETELAPFCGIMKVGGLAQQQPNWEVYDPDGDSALDVEEDEDGIEVPPLSQGSTASDVSVATMGGSKRRLELDDEDEAVVDGARDKLTVLTQRPVATPRRKTPAKMGRAVTVMGQENLDMDLDFGEPDFLDYRLITDIQMGDA